MKNICLKKLSVIVFLHFVFLSSCSFFNAGESIDVRPGNKSKEWSLLVYMCGDNNLESYALEDLYEMERSKLNTKKINVLILFDRHPSYDTTNGNWCDTKFFQLNTSSKAKNYQFISEEISCKDLCLDKDSSVEIDMSSSFVLSTALNYMYENYPAEKYGLIMWGHGSGWRGESNENTLSKGFAYDSTSNSYMGLKQLGEGLCNGLKGKVLDFIGFDTCYGGEIEVMYQLKDYARFAAGSAGLVSSSGWDYEKLFNEFEDCAKKNEETLCNSIIKQFQLQYANTKRASVTSINMEQIQSFFDCFEKYMEEAAVLINGIEIRDKIINSILDKSVLYTEGIGESDVYIDMASLCEVLNCILSENCNADLNNLQTAYNDFRSADEKLILSSWSEAALRSSLGVYIGTLASSGLFSARHPAGYIKGKTADQIDFVQNSNWYVPSGKSDCSFLDKLFYTTKW